MITFFIEKRCKNGYDYYAVGCDKNGKMKYLTFDMLTVLWITGLSTDDLENLAVGEKIYLGGK